MSVVWEGRAARPAPFRPGAAGVALAAVRAPLLVGMLLAGLAVLLVLRVPESALLGPARPVTGHIPRLASRAALAILGIGVDSRGQPLRGPGAVVANHVSWLDIFVLNARKPIFFVAKQEVAGWPLIGWLARATGTLFIRRDPRQAQAQVETFSARLALGHRLLFFPEGTSTDGLRVLPFKPTLFAAFLSGRLGRQMRLQPVSIRYHAPGGQDPRHYGWWGDMALGPHLFKVLATRRQGRVELIYHPPLTPSEHADRKALALACEEAVRAGLADQPSSA